MKTHIVHSAKEDKESGRGSVKNKNDAEKLFADEAVDRQNFLSDRGRTAGNFAGIAAAATFEVNMASLGAAGRKWPTVRG